ncbi:MAG: hypothetical protein QXM75_01475 [Candidatus Diapherotrites archaeon]
MKTKASTSLKELYSLLYNFFGPQQWWPAKTKFEVCVGAILTQNTSWTNVEKAINKLKASKKLTLNGIASLSEKKLASFIRSSGYYNRKAKTLKAFCKHILKNYDGNLEKFFSNSIDLLREELISIPDIGQETADSIILYAAEKPTFVVDAYTERIVARFYGKQFKKREELKMFFERNLPKNTKLYNEFHALLVVLAKNFCRKKPLCQNCPINKNCCYYEYKNLR